MSFKKFTLGTLITLIIFSLHSFAGISVKVDPQAILFDSTDVGDRSDSKTITVKNTGSSKFVIVDIGMTGDEEDFKIINENCEGSILNKDEECTIEVVFAPKSKGVKAAALDLKIIGDGIKTEEVGLSGVATVGGLLEIDPSKHDFGNVDKGDSKSYVFTIKNKSDEAVEVKEIKLELNDDDFRLNLNGGSNPCATEEFILSSGDSCTVEVIFEPESKGIKTSTLAVKYKLSDTELYSAAILNGSAGDFNTNLLDLKIDPSSHDFGKVEVGDSKSIEISIKNDGDKIIEVKDVKLKLNDDDFKINFNGGSNPCGNDEFTLNPETTCTVELIFEPEDKGKKYTVLMVKYKVDGDTSYNAGLYTGKGTEGGDSGSSIGCNMAVVGNSLPVYLLVPLILWFRRFIRRD